MRILVNAASANMGGATTYLTNTTRWMARLAPGVHITVVAPEHSANSLRSDDLPNVSVRAYPFENTGGWRRLWFDQIGLRKMIRETESDVLFSTTGFGTWFSPVPQVLLVRNLAYFDPAFHDLYRRLGRSLRRNSIRRLLSILSIRRADYVLFPTQGMREAVGSWTNLDETRTEALHYGFERAAVHDAQAEPPETFARIRQLKADGYRLLVNVSTYSVQKNLETVVAALPEIVSKAGKVVLATTTSRDRTTDTAEYDALRSLAKECGAAPYWVELGYVSYGQLGMLYDLADVSVFPSITESFGHSMVESMAFGLPVAAADTAVNREVCGPGGVFYAPSDSSACARVVTELLEDPERRHDLGAAALERSADFSWQRHSERLLAILSQLSDRSTRT